MVVMGGFGDGVDGSWWGERKDVSVPFVEFPLCRHCTFEGFVPMSTAQKSGSKKNLRTKNHRYHYRTRIHAGCPIHACIHTHHLSNPIVIPTH